MNAPPEVSDCLNRFSAAARHSAMSLASRSANTQPGSHLMSMDARSASVVRASAKGSNQAGFSPLSLYLRNLPLSSFMAAMPSTMASTPVSLNSFRAVSSKRRRI